MASYAQSVVETVKNDLHKERTEILKHLVDIK